MSANVVRLIPRDELPEPPVALDQTLVAAARGFLAVHEAICPWSDSALIAGLAGATHDEREIIIALLEERSRRHG